MIRMIDEMKNEGNVMGKSIAVALVVFATGAGAVASNSVDDYEVGVSKVSGNKKSVTIDLESNTQNSQCGLVVSALSLVRPYISASVSITHQSSGMIEISAERKTGGICLPAIGSDKASVDFKRGSDLPELKDGSYQLTINDEEVGVVVIQQIEPQVAFEPAGLEKNP